MRSLVVLIAFGGWLVGSSCCRLPYRSIEFGSSGGFTGGTTAYALRSDGQLSSITGSKDSFRVSQKDLHRVKRQVRRIVKRYKSGYDRPANMTNFLRIKTSSAQVEFRWGDAHPPASEVVTLYETLWEITRKHVAGSGH